MDAATAEFHEELEQAKKEHEAFIEKEMLAFKERQSQVELELQESLSQIEAVQQEAASLQSVKEEVKANSEALGIKETELTQLKQSIDKQTEDVS
jgi:polyhydroxyalkanoate synthesis regulator protein